MNKLTFFFDDICICRISNGNEIIINDSTGIEENLLRAIILGPVFAILLNQLGRLVLHASAVNINDGAAVFLGPSGRGKSTTALTLCKNGYNLLSDDVLSIDVDKGKFPLVFPSYPRMKILPEIIKHIKEDPDSIRKVYSDTDKRSYPIIDNYSDTSVPLKTIYLIEEADETIIEDINPKDALIELVKGAFSLKVFDENELFNNFNQCSKIVNKVLVKSLKIKRSLEDLPTLVEIIEKDFMEL